MWFAESSTNVHSLAAEVADVGGRLAAAWGTIETEPGVATHVPQVELRVWRGWTRLIETRSVQSPTVTARCRSTPRSP